MVVPRNWNPIQHQRYPQQTIDEAAPTATDARFKAGAFLLAACWSITVFSLRHSIKYYCPRNRGIFNRFIGLFRYTPLRFMLIVPLAAAVVAYQALVAFNFEYSPLKVGGLKAAIFAGGYTPSLLILYVQIAFAFVNPQRRPRAETSTPRAKPTTRSGDGSRAQALLVAPSQWRTHRLQREHARPPTTQRPRDPRHQGGANHHRPRQPCWRGRQRVRRNDARFSVNACRSTLDQPPHGALRGTIGKEAARAQHGARRRPPFPRGSATVGDKRREETPRADDGWAAPAVVHGCRRRPATPSGGEEYERQLVCIDKPTATAD